MTWSLPSRERGLKYIPRFVSRGEIPVAPFTGAWIEMVSLSLVDIAMSVAPFTGAWIEIYLDEQHEQYHRVAPFTGAWIEISMASAASVAEKSLPSRERGLK